MIKNWENSGKRTRVKKPISVDGSYAQCDDWLLPKTMAASLALRVTIPGTSMEFISGMRPCLDSRP